MFLRLLLLTFIFVGFQSCDSGVDFDNKSTASDVPYGDNQSPTPPVIDPNVIKENCENGAIQTKVVQVDFPKPNYTCKWNQDGNLGIRDLYFQARIEQRQNLGLAANTIICDAEFSFSRQRFKYDDHFMLLFNNTLIAASYDFSDQFNINYFGLLQYDWNKMKGMAWDTSKEMIYCPKINGFQAACSFPGHDSQGYIDLKYDPQYIQAIMSSGISTDHSFALVSIGDNDDKDCEHSDVQFDVQLKYVQLPTSN